jgi:hypothetical protein
MLQRTNDCIAPEVRQTGGASAAEPALAEEIYSYNSQKSG